MVPSIYSAFEQGMQWFCQNSHIFGTICNFRECSGKAMLQDRSHDLTVPVHGVYKREGNLCRH